MRKIFLAVSLFAFLLPFATFAYGKRPIGATRAMSLRSTTGVFIDRQVWLPGTWEVKTGTGSLFFARAHADKVHKSFVSLSLTPREHCGYGFVRIRALKAWGGRFLEQSQGRIEPVSFGTSKYKGYTWVEPTIWNGDRHWCVAQDLKHAMELTAPTGDAELIEFIRNDLLLQLAVRSGRSVFP
ncbi:hypothetical protein HYW84_00725 [Candidatus Peregrinibacteria bacterium]|nr:hypothetical protein [Candidatus Peregrinibacteria bacterium]